MNQEKLIINFTPTGMVPKKKTTPHVPISINEIVEDVHRANELGITIAHLHVRDPQTEEGTYHKEMYGELFSKIRRYAPELILCVSLSGRNSPEFEKRSEPLQLTGNEKPDMGSLTLSSLNFARQASMNSPNMVMQLADAMKQNGIKPELEAFDLGMVNYMKYLISKDLIKPPYYINLLFHNIAGAQWDLLHIATAIRDLPANTYYSLAGLGTSQLAVNATAIFNGSGVRVGLEDNIHFTYDKSKLATNHELLKRVHEIAEIAQREIMSPAEMRQKLNLSPGFGEYGEHTAISHEGLHKYSQPA